MLTLPGDETAEHVISAPGSYYLSGDVAVSKSDGIRIAASHVTLDLAGFGVVRTFGGGGNGIVGVAGTSAVSIANGYVRGFGFQFGIMMSATDRVVVRRVAIENCSALGIWLGNYGSVSDSSVTNCFNGISLGFSGRAVRSVVMGGSGFSGISGGANVVLENCAVYGVRGWGIWLGASATVRDCLVAGGVGLSQSTGGISVGEGSLVVGCVVRSNTTEAAQPTGNTGRGIQVGRGSTVRHCTVTRNSGDGIYGVEYCVIADNHVSENGGGTDTATNFQGHGIRVLTQGSVGRAVIENNRLMGNQSGISISGSNNTIVGNHVLGSRFNSFDIGAGNKVAPIATPPNSTAIAGETGGAGLGTTNPWANFAY